MKIFPKAFSHNNDTAFTAKLDGVDCLCFLMLVHNFIRTCVYTVCVLVSVLLQDQDQRRPLSTITNLLVTVLDVQDTDPYFLGLPYSTSVTENVPLVSPPAQPSAHSRNVFSPATKRKKITFYLLPRGCRVPRGNAVCFPWNSKALNWSSVAKGDNTAPCF